MGHQEHPDTTALRQELQRAGVLPADPEPELEQRAAPRQVNRPLLVAALLAALGGGGWALDAPNAIANLVHKEPRLSIEDAGRALVSTPEFVLLKAQLESVIRKQDLMDGKLDVLVSAEDRRKGREDAIRERRER